MSQVIWLDKYDTGIAEIDVQHQQIVLYLNELNAARLRGDIKGVKEVLEGIVDYTMSHFAFEEALMEQAEYAFSRAHKSVHETFTKRVEKFRGRFAAGEDIADELSDVLKRWLINHIQRDDAAYVRPVSAHLRSLTKEESVAPEGKVRGSWLSRAVKKFFGSNP